MGAESKHRIDWRWRFITPNGLIVQWDLWGVGGDGGAGKGLRMWALTYVNFLLYRKLRRKWDRAKPQSEGPFRRLEYPVCSLLRFGIWM